jgi:hypothetical protein
MKLNRNHGQKARQKHLEKRNTLTLQKKIVILYFVSSYGETWYIILIYKCFKSECDVGVSRHVTWYLLTDSSLVLMVSIYKATYLPEDGGSRQL